jgi:Glycine rich protein
MRGAVGGSLGNRRRRRLAGGLPAAGLVAALLIPVAVGVAPQVAAADPTLATQTLTFGFTGGPQSFTVPPGVTSVTFDLTGGQGQGKDDGSIGGGGGEGGEATDTMAVTPGTTYQIYVGGSGDSGGWNGGAIGGTDGIYYEGDIAGTGGGATDVRTGADGLSDRLLVAGGGGGSGDVGASGGSGEPSATLAATGATALPTEAGAAPRRWAELPARPTLTG